MCNEKDGTVKKVLCFCFASFGGIYLLEAARLYQLGLPIIVVL